MQIGWLKALPNVIAREQIDQFSSMVAIFYLLVAGVEDFVERCLTVSFELVVSGLVLLSVLIVREEACRIVLVFCVAEVVHVFAKRVANMLLQLIWVFLLVDVELSSGVLQLVSGGCAPSL